jgi:hypothetical protein
MIESPDFATLSRIEESLLVAKLEATRLSISHAGEKGRALEQLVLNFLRDLLPAEYGLSTGFVVWLSPTGPKLSSQLDIIIYDAIRSGPLIRLSTCNVFPIEAVYGYVEVKASLRSSSDNAKEPADNSIEKCIAQNVIMRGMNRRSFWAPTGDSPISMELIERSWLSLRAYVIAFEAEGSVVGDLKSFAKRLADQLKLAGGAHFHGVFIPNHGLLYTRPVDVTKAVEDDYFHVRYTGDHALLEFKTSLLQALATFPRPQENWTPALDRYFEHETRWYEQTPMP